MKSSESNDVSTLCRRLVGICFNNGLALNLLDLLKTYLTINTETLSLDQKLNLKYIDLAIEPEDIESINQVLEVQCFNLKNFVARRDSEAQYRAMFWDSVLTKLLHPHTSSLHDKRKFKLRSEWETQTLFTELEKRKIDFTALWSGIPLMVVEMGKEEFGTGVNSHKDFAKVLGIISHSCRKLALELERQGKKAENAQIFGIWIGGTQIHFITGMAVITQASPNTYSIQCNCYYPDEWKFEVQLSSTLSDVPSTDEATGTAASPITTELVSSTAIITESSEIDLPTSPLARFSYNRIPSKRELLEFEPEVVPEAPNNSASTSESEPKGGDYPVNYFHLEEQEQEQEQEQIETIIDLLSDEEDKSVDPNTLVKLNRFITEFMEYVDSISRLDSNNPRRDFQDPEQIGFFSESRKGSNKSTPRTERVKYISSNANAKSISNKPIIQPDKSSAEKDPKKNKEYYEAFYISRGRSIDELNLYRKYLCLNPSIFPRLVEYFDAEDSEETGLYDLVFENMDPFIQSCENDYVLSKHLWYSSSGEALLNSLKLTIELLSSLDLLHSTLGLVHADISPSNIMFSTESGVWKLIDFGESMKISVSASTARESGTTNYISPESLETGIFTEASDVFALGRVIEEVLYFKLIFMFESRSQKNDLIFKSFLKYENILFKMMNPNPSDRISVRSALLCLYEIISKFPSQSFDPDLAVYLRLGALYEESLNLKRLEQDMELVSVSSSSSKRHKKEFTKEKEIIKSAPLSSGEFD